MKQATPPPSRPPGMGNIRMRRMSAPFQTSQRDLAAIATAASATANDPDAPPVRESRPETTESVAIAEKEPRRDSTLLFPMQQSRQEHNELAVLLASLQQNVQGLTASNQREKAMADHLKKHVQALTTELAKTRELYDEEKTKNEKIVAMRKNQKNGGSELAGYLPDIHSAATAAAAAVALQQQAQLELTYQRKILSLENRYKDSMENNKRLLKKIEQLEKTEKDADALIDNLRQENVRLGTQVDSLSSTVTSQSSLIIGLRTSLQKLNQDERQMGALMKKFDRSQIELEATKVREKILRDEHERSKLIMTKEKESLRAKIVDFQQRLQLSDRASDNVEGLEERIHRLEFEKRMVVDEMLVLRDNAAKAETRMHEQEQMTNRLLLENEAILADKKELVLRIARIQEALDSKSLLEAKLADLQLKEREVEQLMAKTLDLQEDLDRMAQANAKLQEEVTSVRRSQLSHDETVQALQLARQKAATHEALALVNEEKETLVSQLRDLQEEATRERTLLDDQVRVLETKLHLKQEQLDSIAAELADLKNRPVDTVIVETVIRSSIIDVDERSRVEADIERLREEYGELRETFDNMEREYNKLVTKKYKTESFQSQVKLLQNENDELGSRVEDLLRDQERDRAELQLRATEIVELRSRVLDPQVIDMLRQTQESLEKTVSSLVEAEIASESTFTCLQCMRLFVSPMTLTPCGHTYCSSCVDSMGNVSIPSSIQCRECSPTQQDECESIFPNQSLADLTARFIFRQQTLSSLTTMCLSLRNSFANRSRS